MRDCRGRVAERILERAFHDSLDSLHENRQPFFVPSRQVVRFSSCHWYPVNDFGIHWVSCAVFVVNQPVYLSVLFSKHARVVTDNYLSLGVHEPAEEQILKSDKASNTLSLVGVGYGTHARGLDCCSV